MQVKNVTKNPDTQSWMNKNHQRSILNQQVQAFFRANPSPSSDELNEFKKTFSKSQRNIINSALKRVRSSKSDGADIANTGAFLQLPVELPEELSFYEQLAQEHAHFDEDQYGFNGYDDESQSDVFCTNPVYMKSAFFDDDEDDSLSNWDHDNWGDMDWGLVRDEYDSHSEQDLEIYND